MWRSSNPSNARRRQIRPTKEDLSFTTDTLQPIMTDEFVFCIATSAQQIQDAALADG
jgi:hypothetical protein